MNESYVLTQEDLDPGLDGHDFPAVKVAGNVDPAVLSSLLSCGWQKSPFYNTEPNNALALRYGPNAFMDFFMVYTTPSSTRHQISSAIQRRATSMSRR